MRIHKILKKLGIIFLIICIVFIAIDLFKVLKINFDFLGMQSSERISSSAVGDAIKYEPTNYIISNKNEALEEIKKITVDLKNEYINSDNKEKLFEIGNIHKIENLFYNYESYLTAKYKLVNFIEELPNLYSKTKGYSDSQLKTFYSENMSYAEEYYGIITSKQFVSFAKSLSFLKDNKINIVYIDVSTINFDYEKDRLTFDIILETNSDMENYLIMVDYYNSTDNQIRPYVKITKE